MNLLAYVQLARPLNGFIAFISVIFGALLAKGNGDFVLWLSHRTGQVSEIIFASIVALMLLSAGNAFNDYCDVESDKINKPNRPIPSGKINRHSALIFSIFLFAIGTGLGLLVNKIAFIVAFLVSLVLLLYAKKLRKFPLIANSTVGLLTGLTFIYGGIAVKTISGTIIPSIFAFLFTSAREIVKDIQDVEGDQSAGLSSLAIKWGNKKAVYISLVFFALLIIASPIPYILGYYSIYYLISVILGIDVVLVYCILSLLQQPSKQVADKIANIMKFDIFVGLIAIYLGRFGL